MPVVLTKDNDNVQVLILFFLFTVKTHATTDMCTGRWKPPCICSKPSQKWTNAPINGLVEEDISLIHLTKDPLRKKSSTDGGER